MWFVKKIFRDYEVHNTLVQLFFPMIFMLSCTMFELIIFEIAAVLESGYCYQCLLKVLSLYVLQLLMSCIYIISKNLRHVSDMCVLTILLANLVHSLLQSINCDMHWLLQVPLLVLAGGFVLHAHHAHSGHTLLFVSLCCL